MRSRRTHWLLVATFATVLAACSTDTVDPATPDPYSSPTATSTRGLTEGYFLTEGAQVPMSAAENMEFGYRVEIVEGRVYATAPGTDLDTGSAHIFLKSQAFGWVESATLSFNGADENERAGESLATNGKFLIMGAPYAVHPDGASPGVSYAFENGPGGWNSNEVRQEFSSFEADRYGTGVAVNDTIAVAGAPLHRPEGFSGSPGCGVIYTYTYEGADPQNLWKDEEVLSANDRQQGDGYGSTLAIEGDRLAVGAPTQGSGTKAGAVYVYDRAASSWTPQGKITPVPLVDGSEFGHALDVESGQVLVGAPNFDGGGGRTGAVFLYEKIGNSWTTTASFVSPNPIANGRFGESVSFDGSRMIIGAPGEQHDGATTGAAYVYDRIDGMTWSTPARLVPEGIEPTSPVNGSRFGQAVAIDGDIAVVGAPRAKATLDGSSQGDVGAIFIYEFALELPEVDMGQPDLGQPDMGQEPEDMGQPEVDMGAPEVDMGSPQVDMGQPEVDMGTEQDAGAEPPDTEVPEFVTCSSSRGSVPMTPWGLVALALGALIGTRRRERLT